LENGPFRSFPVYLLKGIRLPLKATSSQPGVNVSQRGDLETGRPFPLAGSLTLISSDANSIYHSLQAEASRRLTKGLGFTLAYTWSHAIDEVSDIFDLAGAQGCPRTASIGGRSGPAANFDLRHRLAASFVLGPAVAERELGCSADGRSPASPHSSRASRLRSTPASMSISMAT
jgi:hypothetical protein